MMRINQIKYSVNLKRLLIIFKDEDLNKESPIILNFFLFILYNDF